MPDDPTPPSDDQPVDDPDLGDAGKRALDAERNKARSEERARKAAEKKAADLEARLAEFDSASKSEHEKAIEAARKEASAAATAEATTRANRRILTAEIKAAAGTLLADPSDAVRLLDIDEFDVTEDGEVDDKAITAAIKSLLDAKPYLAANAKSNGVPDLGQGVRTNGGPIDPRAADIAQIEADLRRR